MEDISTELQTQVHILLRTVELELTKLLNKPVRVRIYEKSAKLISVERILEIVSSETGVPIRDMKGKSHKPNIVRARTQAMQLCRINVKSNSTTFLANVFNNKNHSSVCNNTDRHETFLFQDKEYVKEYNNLETLVALAEEELTLNQI